MPDRTMSSIIDELEMISKRPRKSLGQHFLRDRDICRRIVNNIPIQKGAMVTEIGPGMGALTEELLHQGYKVKALELDPDLVSHLEIRFKDQIGSFLQIENIDAIKALKQGGFPSDQFIISNLPYNISSSLLGFLLDSVDLSHGTSGFKGAMIMFQKEFGNRLVAVPGGKDYGKISVMFHLKMDYKVLFQVPKDRFYPQPKVDGIVILFSPKVHPEVIPKDNKFLRTLVTTAFINRRKKLKNSILPGSLDLDLDVDVIRSILKEMNIIDERPERLSPSDFVELSNKVFEASR